jgi:hypothetical protein
MAKYQSHQSNQGKKGFSPTVKSDACPFPEENWFEIGEQAG